MPSTWAPVVFWILLVPLLIVMLIVYLRSKKFNRLVYILSVFTYAMAILYWIDAYQLGRNAIVGILVLSSAFMILLGRQMSKKKRKKKTHLSAGVALGTLCIIAIIVGISAIPIGWTVEKNAVQNISLEEVVPIIEEGKPIYRKGTPIYTLTVANRWIPRQYELPEAQACLYNSEQDAYDFAEVYWDIRGQRTDFGPQDVLELGQTQQKATLLLGSRAQVRPLPVDVPDYEPQTYDTLYLFLNEGDRRDHIECYNLQDSQIKNAVKIPIN